MTKGAIIVLLVLRVAKQVNAFNSVTHCGRELEDYAGGYSGALAVDLSK